MCYFLRLQGCIWWIAREIYVFHRSNWRKSIHADAGLQTNYKKVWCIFSKIHPRKKSNLNEVEILEQVATTHAREFLETSYYSNQSFSQLIYRIGLEVQSDEEQTG